MSKDTISKPFRFKQFTIEQDQCTMKVGTDGVLLGAWAAANEVNLALDIGTGTGLIAIMLAQRLTGAHIHAVEINESACQQAQNNMANSPWSNHLQAFFQPIQEYAKVSSEKYDLIVSNPPFFSGGTFSQNQDKTNVRHTVKLPHGDLLSAVRSLLAEDGKFCIILPLIEGLRFRELALSYQLYCSEIMEVIPKVDHQVERLLMKFGKEEIALKKSQLIVYKEQPNVYTEEYVALTKAFYLDF